MERIFVFLALFSLVYFLESIGGSYIISAIQNIKKQFQIPSKIAGFMVSASDLGYIPSILFVSYLGSRGNRARWIGGGAIMMSIMYILIASPNFIFPVAAPAANLTGIQMELIPTLSQLGNTSTLSELLSYPLVKDRLPHKMLNQLLALDLDTKNIPMSVSKPHGHLNTSHYSHYSVDGWLLEKIYDSAEEIIKGEPKTEELVNALRQYLSNRAQNSTRDLFRIRRSANAPFSFCGRMMNNIREITQHTKCTQQGGNFGPFMIMFIALFFLGIGRTMPWSLGVPLLDDNIKKKSLPAYFGAISFIRILGPISGNLIGSFTNKIYYTLNPPIGLTASDPTWIGAWWLGFLAIGTVALVPSTALFLFPSGKSKGKISPSDVEKKKDTIEFYDKHRESVKDVSLKERMRNFARSYKQVLSTKIYRWAVVGRVCDILAFKGYIVFLPKYLENHFGIPLFKVHQYMAFFGVFGFALGTATGGFVTKRFRLTGRQAALFVLVISTVNISTFVAKAFISCESIVNSIGIANKDDNYNFTKQCNMDCGCDGVKLYPVCDIAGNPFFSPCHGGCRDVKINDNDSRDIEFSSCECSETGVLRKDFCKDNCRWPIIIFFGTVLFGSFFGGMGMVPGMLILLRSVPPATRSISLGLQGLLVSAFGFLPSPVIWGMVVDSACLVWEHACDGRKGSCSIYDPRSLRMRMHFLYVGIRIFSLITDVYVWYHAKDLNLLDEETKETKSEEVEKAMEESHQMNNVTTHL